MSASSLNTPAKGRIAVTMGDPSGVGCEVIRNWAFANPEMRKRVEVIGLKTFLDTLPDDVSVREVGDASFKAVSGSPSTIGCAAAFEALKEAAVGCDNGLYSAVVTGPISKFEMRKVGFNYAGQTEFFADVWRGTPVMAFAGEKLLVSLVTWHIPLSEVPKAVNAQNIARAVECAALLAVKKRGIKNPKIAVCAVNPHAGEDGIMGREEIDVINPVLDSLRERFPNLSKALPPDTVFERTLKGEFDCIVGMYHDQALSPLKAIEFDKAVNVSMNLRHLRTSPDHGTAYGIAGRGIASYKSFEAAVNLAYDFTK